MTSLLSTKSRWCPGPSLLDLLKDSYLRRNLELVIGALVNSISIETEILAIRCDDLTPHLFPNSEIARLK